MKARTLVVALFLGALPVSSGAFVSNACASEGARAALVIDTGGGVHRYCVDLPKSRVSGIELIRLASAQHGLQYRLGFGGNAVCQLAGVGPEGDDCFAEDPYFWGYWRGGGSGGWTWSGSGAGSTAVGDGSVEGWSWGTGRDGSSHPKPPATGFDSVCPPAASPAGGGSAAPASPAGSGEGARRDAAGDKGSSTASTERSTNGKENKKKKARRRAASRDRPAAARADGTVSPGNAIPAAAIRPGEPLSAVPSDGEGQGPPPVGLAGVVLAAGLGLFAVRRGRRRRVG